MALYIRYNGQNNVGGGSGGGSVTTVGPFDSEATPSANGATILTGSIIFQSASATVPGMVNTGAQTFAGNKTFNGTITASNLSGTNTGDVTLTAVGSAPNTNGAILTGQALTLEPANTSFPGVLLAADWNTFNNKQGTVTIGALDAQAGNANGLALVANVLSTQSASASVPGVVNNTAQTLSGAKTFTGTLTSVNTAGGDGTGFVLQSNSGFTWSWAAENNSLYLIHPGANQIITVSSNQYIGFGAFSTGLRYPWEFAESDNSTNPSADLVPNSVSHNLAVINLRNANAGTGTYSGLTFSGQPTDSTSVTSSILGIFDSNTSGAETGHLSFLTRLAGGTLTQRLRIDATGLLAANTTASTALVTDASNYIQSSATTAAEIGFVSGVTSSIQTQLNGKLSLTGGTMSGIINMGSNKITNVTDPTAAQDAATKNYVDMSVAALNPQASVYAATTGSNIAGTYINGVAGVGATFTTTATGVFTVDGVTPPLATRILIKDQTSGFQNGIYSITTLGTIGVSTVFTRSLDYNTASDMNSAGLIPVINGTLNALSSWQQVAFITMVGTDSLIFTEFTANPSLYLLKANNLSDVASKSTSFNNLSPMTASGDIIYGGTSGAGTKLAIGSTGQVLTVVAGIPAWAAGGSGANTSPRFTLSGATVPFICIDGCYYVRATNSIATVNISMLNSGTSGSTTIQVNQYRSGALQAIATASLSASSGNPAGAGASLFGTLSVASGDILTVDVNSIAGGVPSELSVEPIFS